MKRLVLFVILLCGFQGFGQNYLSLYNMRHIPQVVYANPAFTPLGRINISIPGLGSSYAQVGKSDFDVDVSQVDNNGNLTFDTKKFLNGLQDSNTVYANSSVEIFHFGMALGKNYFFVSAMDNVDADFVFPKEMAVFITEVYNDFGIIGRTDIQSIQLNANHHREYGLGWSRKFSDKLSFGAHVKLLTGITNVLTNSSGIFIDGTSGTEITGVASVDIQSSGVQSYIENPQARLTSFDNFGYSFDLGMEYHITEKIKVAASALDIMGTINWNTEIENVVTDSMRVDFTTIDWSDFTQPGSAADGFVDFVDSLLQNADSSKSEIPYTTKIPAKILGSFTYSITPKLDATCWGQVSLNEDGVQNYLRIGIQGRFKRFLNYMVSYSIIDDFVNPQNLGLGLAVNIGPLQVHALTDNIFDPFLFKSDFNPSLRFGLNFTFGRDHE